MQRCVFLITLKNAATPGKITKPLYYVYIYNKPVFLTEVKKMKAKIFQSYDKASIFATRVKRFTKLQLHITGVENHIKGNKKFIQSLRKRK